MTGIPDDLKALLDPAYDRKADKRPVFWLWVYDGTNDKVTITHNEDRPPAHAVIHKDLAQEAHPAYRLEGYAYSIRGGFRITDADSRPLQDPHIITLIKHALKAETR